MTLYVNLRGNAYGAVCSPYILEGSPESSPVAMTSVDWTAVPPRVVGKDVILATHGFSVSYLQGVRSLGRLEAHMNIRNSEIYMGVLWPGDWIAPAINYPFEDGVASRSGEFLGQFIARWLRSARSVSLISHSLGARVMLMAIQVAAPRRIKRACLTAGAVNSGCLTEEFTAAAANCDDIVTLSSMADWVLGLAYPPGDALADLLDPDHPPFEAALGRHGPTTFCPSPLGPCQIPDDEGFLHSDYLPPEADPPPPFMPDPAGKWMTTAKFMSSVMRGAQPVWPGWP